MQVTTRLIRNWADENAIPDLTLAELDYRLVYALQAIHADPFLRDHLCLKGGTALNKLYLPEQGRLSVDLDFNAVGSKEQVLEERTRFSQTAIAVLRQQDSAYDLTYRWRYDQATVYARFSPLTGVAQQRLKLEISFMERFAILGQTGRTLVLPSGEPIAISTYNLEELASTKLRALHDRKKGRDMYDLFHIAGFDLNRAAIRKMVLYYFYRARKVFSYPAFVDNIEQKIAERGFRGDVSGLIRQGRAWDWQAARAQVLNSFAFLGELDDRDALFLDLVKYWLRKPYPRASGELVRAIEHPLNWLMEGLPISAEAAAATQEDIKLYFPGANAAPE